MLKGGVMWDMAPTLGQYRIHELAVDVNGIIDGERTQQMGTWLTLNIVFDLNSNGTNVRCLPGQFAGKFTGHIYWHAALHSCSSSSSYCESVR